MRLEAIASCAIASYLGEETSTCLTTTSFQVGVESSKVPPQLLVQTKQPQLPQWLLIRLVLKTPHQPCCPSLDTLQQLNVLLIARGPSSVVSSSKRSQFECSRPSSQPGNLLLTVSNYACSLHTRGWYPSPLPKKHAQETQTMKPPPTTSLHQLPAPIFWFYNRRDSNKWDLASLNQVR